jgi:hypothetical protein
MKQWIRVKMKMKVFYLVMKLAMIKWNRRQAQKIKNYLKKYYRKSQKKHLESRAISSARSTSTFVRFAIKNIQKPRHLEDICRKRTHIWAINININNNVETRELEIANCFRQRKKYISKLTGVVLFPTEINLIR